MVSIERSRKVQVLTVLVGGLALAWFAQAAFAAGSSQSASKAAPAKVTVTLGKPSELKIKLSKTQVPVGTVVFTVVNRGALGHNFKVCTKAVTSLTANSCTGKTTVTLAAGKSATLTVVFKAKGSFEFLCTVPGHAAAGMKGLLGIGQKAVTGTPAGTTTTSTTPTTTTKTGGTTTTATKPPATETLVGTPANGAPIFTSSGCGSCHTLAASGSNGTAGPNLDSLAPGQSIIVTQVTNGGFNMPAFGATLTPSQINDLASYIYQSTHQ